MRDREARKISRTSLTASGDEANNVSFSPVLSAYGNVVAYLSLASNLVTGDTGAGCVIFPFRITRCEHIDARVTP